MFSREFFYWCREAVSGIKYKPDRDAVYAELYEHLEDRYESLTARGLSHEEAETKALEAMGNAGELAPQLAAIHKPHWAYAMIVTRILLIALLCLCFGHGVVYLLEKDFSQPLNIYGYDPFGKSTATVQDIPCQRVLYVQSGESVTIDGYTFTLTKAAMWEHTRIAEDGSTYKEQPFFFRIRVTNPIPWAKESQIWNDLWAVDSLGNYYYSSRTGHRWNENTVLGNSYHTAPFIYEHDMQLIAPATPGYREADWVEIHYDRSGRDLTLRIDLTGEGQR